MIKKILIGVVITLILGFGVLTYVKSTTKKHSPAATALYQSNGYDITVNYCRPYKKGRVIFGTMGIGALQEFGKYWRVGANEATTFETKTPLLVGDKTLPAGKYALYAIPGSGLWTVAFNTENDRWGATPPDEKNDVIRVSANSSERENLQEQFLLSFEPADSAVNMIFYWDNTKVFVPLRKP